MAKGNWSSSKRDAIELLNAALGTRYRSRPYDMNNPDDVAHMVTYVTGEFMDLCHYSSEIGSLLEHLDESIETYYPAEWIAADLKIDDVETDIPIRKAYFQLCATEDNIIKARDEAAARCKEIWRLFLANPLYSDKVQKVVDVEKIPVPDMKLLNEIDIIELAIDIDWPYTVERSAKQFGRSLLKAVALVEKQ